MALDYSYLAQSFFLGAVCLFSKTLLSTTWVINSKAQVVSCLPFSTKAQVQSQIGLCGNYGAQSSMGRVYLRVRWFSPVSIISRLLLQRR